MNRTPIRCQQGFTLLELLVSIAIIGVLLAILMPAVQQAREAARRSTCRSNLRQLGMAMHAYHDVHRIFPPGNTKRFSAFVCMLPYLEQTALYDQVDFSLPFRPQSEALSRYQLTVLLCPSDSGSNSVKGVTNYVGNNGAGLHVSGMMRGVFTLLVRDSVNGGGPVSSAMVTDGLSNTAALSELLIATGAPDARRTVWRTSRFPLPENSPRFIEACETLDTSTSRGNKWDRGRPWGDGNYASTFYNHTATPNHRACTNGGDVFLGSYPAASLHSGGATICFADGAVKFISDSVDIDTWQSIGTIASSDTIGDF